jgi:hypothetical protein
VICPLFVHPEWSADTDHLMHILPQLHLDILTLAGYPYVRLTKFTKKIQRRSSLLAQGELQGVFLAALTDSLFNVTGNAVKSVGREEPIYSLVRALVVVIADPVIEPLAGIGKGSKKRVL